MMTLSFTLPIKASTADIWNLYAHIERWNIWEENLESISLEGDFITGTKGKMKLKEKPEIDFLLTNIIPEQRFENKTSLPFGDLYFNHTIKKTDNYCLVTHSVTLHANNPEKHYDLLQQIFSNLPASVMQLKKVAEAI